jgi:hypothetical protein
MGSALPMEGGQPPKPHSKRHKEIGMLNTDRRRRREAILAALFVALLRGGLNGADQVAPLGGCSRCCTPPCSSRTVRRPRPWADNRERVTTTTSRRLAKTPQSFRACSEPDGNPGSVLPKFVACKTARAVPQSPLVAYHLRALSLFRLVA